VLALLSTTVLERVFMLFVATKDKDETTTTTSAVKQFFWQLGYLVPERELRQMMQKGEEEDVVRREHFVSAITRACDVSEQTVSAAVHRLFCFLQHKRLVSFRDIVARLSDLKPRDAAYAQFVHHQMHSSSSSDRELTLPQFRQLLLGDSILTERECAPVGAQLAARAVRYGLCALLVCDVVATTSRLAPVRGVSVRFAQLSVVTLAQQRRTVVHNAHGVLRAGRVCAIVGTRRAARHALIRALAGTVRIDAALLSGLALSAHSHVDAAPGSAGLITKQQQQQQQQLTARQRLEFAAEFSMLDNRNNNEISACFRGQVNAVLGATAATMTLSPQLAQHLVRGTSYLLLEDCFDSLDLCDALRLARLLHALARHGYTIVVSTARLLAEFEELVDDVIVLTRDGGMAYSGAVADARVHLEHACRRRHHRQERFASARVAVNACTQKSRAELSTAPAMIAAASAASAATAAAVPAAMKSSSNVCRRFALLHRRTTHLLWQQQRRTYCALFLLDALLSAVFVGLAFFQLSGDDEHVVFCMYVLLALALLGGAAYAEAAARLDEIFEQRLYSAACYASVQLVAHVPLLLLRSACLAAPAYVLCGFHVGLGSIAQCLVLVFLALLTGRALRVLCSGGGGLVAAPLLLPLLLFNLIYCGVLRGATSALAYATLPYHALRVFAEQQALDPDIVQRFELDELALWVNYTCLVVLALGCTALALACTVCQLKRKSRRRTPSITVE
jgi:ABC-type multidrug transport system ATPase subunit